MARNPDAIYQAFGEHAVYQLRPNPDSEPGSGYKYGAVLEWRDDVKDPEWKGHFFIEPDALLALSRAFNLASYDMPADD